MFHSITAYLITYISPQARTTQLINQMNCWIEFFFAAIFPFTDEQVFVKLSTKVTNCKTLKTISSTTQITQIILGWKWNVGKQTNQQFSFYFPEPAETVGWKWWELKLIIASSETWTTFLSFFFPSLSLWSGFLIFVHGLNFFL